MATTNFITSATHAYTGGAAGNPGALGIDENVNTYHGDDYNVMNSGASKEIISEHTFSSPCTLTQIKYKLYVHAKTTGPSGNRNFTTYIQYKPNGGAYTDIIRYTGGGGADGENTYDSAGLVTDSTGWSNVIAIKIYAYIYSDAQDGWASGQAYIYEIEAFGEGYTAIGIKYRKGLTTYNIGTETLTASHKIRIRKGSTTYGIPLLASGDANASPIFIYDGANKKAFPIANI